MRFIILACFIALPVSGCGEVAKDALSGAAEKTITDRLKNGDTSVCADSGVQQTALTIIAGQQIFGQRLVQEYIAAGGKLEPLTAVSATGVDDDIDEVSCTGNVQEGAIKYRIRPSLTEGEDYIVEAQAPQYITDLIAGSMAILIGEKQRQQTVHRQSASEVSEAVGTEGVVDAPAGQAYDAACASGDEWACNIIDEQIERGHGPSELKECEPSTGQCVERSPDLPR